ncbi:G/U mismatch-specific DNA glycosylase [Ensifer adhaerens]|nr:G/U mismatch-specific DNA glycosylase [Ensifer adhaerens]
MADYEPNILENGLKVVFCGLNPGISTQSSGHSFSTPSNRFWNVLYLAGFTDVRLEPKDERHLLAYGCGLTTAIRRATRRASEISAAEFRDARPDLEERIRDVAPCSIAFLSKRALAEMLQARDVTWGRQRLDFGGVPTWVLPNPSGLNRGFSLDALVRAYSTFRHEIEHGPASSHSSLASIAIARGQSVFGNAGRLVSFATKRSASSGIDKIDRSEKVHFADVDAVVAKDRVDHRNVKIDIRDCHLQKVVLAA